MSFFMYIIKFTVILFIEVLIQFDSNVYDISRTETVSFNLTLSLSTTSDEDVFVEFLIHNVSGYGEYCNRHVNH